MRTQGDLDSAGAERARASRRCQVLGVASGRPGPSRTGPSFPAQGGRRTVCVLRGQAGAGEVLGGSRALGRGWGCFCSNSKESCSDQTDACTHDGRAFLSVSPPEALLGLPLEPGWMGASAGLVSLEHTRPSVCPSLLVLVLVLMCVSRSVVSDSLQPHRL